MGVQALIGGMDDSGGHIFMLDPLGRMMEEKFVSTGSGAPVAYGVLESEWKDTMNVKEAVPVVVRAIDAAMKRDSDSGDSFHVAVICMGGDRHATEADEK